MEIDDLLHKYFEGETTAEEEKALRDFFRSEEVPGRLADCKPLFAYFDEEIRKSQNTTGKVQPGIRRRLYWAAAVAASVIFTLGVWQTYTVLVRPASCLSSSGYVIIDGRCYADVEKARTMAMEALLNVATSAEDFFPDKGFFNDN
jgi:hypothetical protein